MHWILQTNLFNEKKYRELVDTLDRFGIPYSIHKVVPFVGELMPEPDLTTKNVMCMGSYSLRHAAKKYGWTPGVWDIEQLDFTVQREKWGTNMLNFDSVVSRFEDGVFPTDEPYFIRPIQDSKVFAGKIFEKDEFYDWKRRVCVLEHDYGDSLGKDTLIQISPLKEIYSEHRHWVSNGRIITSSTYKEGSRVIYKPVIDKRIGEYAQLMIDVWRPADAFVIDIADTSEGLKIVEINTLNSCGFYDCDIQKLVSELEFAYSAKPAP